MAAPILPTAVDPCDEAFRANAGDALSRFTQEIMRGPAPLSPGMRELIAAFTSYRNDCPF